MGFYDPVTAALKYLSPWQYICSSVAGGGGCGWGPYDLIDRCGVINVYGSPCFWSTTYRVGIPRSIRQTDDIIKKEIILHWGECLEHCWWVFFLLFQQLLSAAQYQLVSDPWCVHSLYVIMVDATFLHVLTMFLLHSITVCVLRMIGHVLEC